MDQSRKKYLKDKEQYLIDNGYYHYVYKKEDDDPLEYSRRRLNPETNKLEYYKIVVDDISDEEYEEMLKNEETEKTDASQNNNQDIKQQKIQKYQKYSTRKSSSNIIATNITIIAFIVFAFAFILGIVYGNTFKTISLDNLKPKEEFNVLAMFITWGIGAVSGTLLLGFAEIIKLLQRIADK